LMANQVYAHKEVLAHPAAGPAGSAAPGAVSPAPAEPAAPGAAADEGER
jgi:hypothetical protein